MKLKTITIWAAILLVGIGIGRLLPRGAPDAGTTAGKTAIGDRPAPIRTRVSDREDIFAGKNRASGHSVASSMPVVPEDGAGMVLVPSTLIGELSRAAGKRTRDQELFSRDGRIEEALGITDSEKAAIQNAWLTSRQRTRDLEVGSMTTEEIDEWSVRITVPDLSQSVASLGKEFRTAVQRALGGNRSEAFLAAKQVDGMFSPPVGDQIYTVTSESIGDGRWRYHMTLEGSGERRVWVGESIPDELRHLTDAARIQPSLGDS